MVLTEVTVSFRGFQGVGCGELSNDWRKYRCRSVPCNFWIVDVASLRVVVRPPMVSGVYGRLRERPTLRERAEQNGRRCRLRKREIVTPVSTNEPFYTVENQREVVVITQSVIRVQWVKRRAHVHKH